MFSTTQNLRFTLWLNRVLFIAACLSACGFPFPAHTAAQTVTQVSAGFYHSIFLESDGSLWGMGNNGVGQLGLGPGLSETNLPQLIVSTNVSAIAAGCFGSQSLFVESNGTLWAMGDNEFGQLGDGTTNSQYYPEQIESGQVTGVAAGAADSLFTTFTPGGRFVLPTFALWAMGNSSAFGGSGNLQLTPGTIQSTQIAFDAVDVVASGEEATFYIRADGSLWGTGDNQYGEIGTGTEGFVDNFEEIVSSNVTAVATGQYHSLFIKSDGSLWAMGYNTSGQLGDGSTGNLVLSPEQVATNVIAIAVGFEHSLFIKSDGSLWGMGSDGNGELGYGTGTNQPLPVQIVASNVVAVAAGVDWSFFIKSDGSLWGMGDNRYGQLGDGTAYNGYNLRHFPVQIVPLVIPEPAITSISLANTNLVLSGTNGESGRNYFTLMSTNLALPLSRQFRKKSVRIVCGSIPRR